MRQQEVSLKNKVHLLERQSKRLNEETREQQETIGQLEQLNRQLRNELSKVVWRKFRIYKMFLRLCSPDRLKITRSY